MGQRADLQAILIELCENVYFQPPESAKLSYPCIIYKLDFAKTEFANNKPYSHKERYLVTYVDRDPDNTVRRQIATLPECVFDRRYTADLLNHDVFKLFF